LEKAVDDGMVQAALALYDQHNTGAYVPVDQAAATHWLLRAAEMGSPRAVNILAAMLDRSDPAAPPVEQVAELLKRSAAQGDADAQANLALWYLEGKHIGRNEALANGWFERAAHGGNALAQSRLGDLLSSGAGAVKADPDAAAAWYERAALQGHAGATLALTTMRMAAGTNPAGMSDLFGLWLQGAEKGDAMAQRVVGEFYLRRTGVDPSMPEEQRMAEAQRWLNASSDQGNTAAMVMLGGVILQNQEESARFPEAVDLFRRAATSGNADAEYNLGVCLRRGLGIAVDDKAAEHFYRSAAERNHVSAQLALGDLIAQSATSDVQWLEAARWYRLAADSGNAPAKERLAQMQERRAAGPAPNAPAG
jgi:TPR repeat protein